MTLVFLNVIFIILLGIICWKVINSNIIKLLLLVLFIAGFILGSTYIHQILSI